MDWQQPMALGVVAITAWLMVRAVLRNRRAVRLGQPGTGCGCGCPAASGERPAEQILYRARKGQRPELVVRPGDRPVQDRIGAPKG